jgi:chorismate mutase
LFLGTISSVRICGSYFLGESGGAGMRGLKIGDWRTKIDAIDTTLLHLLNVRAAFALEVGKLKGEAGLMLRVPAREREILSRMKKLNPGPLDGEAVEKIYQLILDESIRIQESYGYGAGARSKSKANGSRGKQRKPRLA